MWAGGNINDTSSLTEEFNKFAFLLPTTNNIINLLESDFEDIKIIRLKKDFPSEIIWGTVSSFLILFPSALLYIW